MADITITINTDNAAFGQLGYEQSEEVSRILRKLATDVELAADIDYHTLRDFNGNHVGEMRVTKD